MSNKNNKKVIKLPTKGKCDKPQEVNISTTIVETGSLPILSDDAFDI